MFANYGNIIITSICFAASFVIQYNIVMLDRTIKIEYKRYIVILKNKIKNGKEIFEDGVR